MKIVFLTMTPIDNLDAGYIYTELMKVFIKKGHDIVIVSPTYNKDKPKFEMLSMPGYRLVKIRVLQGGKASLFQKAVNTVMLESWYIKAVKKYLSNENFDLVLYSTPPVTLSKAIRYIKNTDNAKTYLMLKDIFPQNAVDLGMMSKSGIKSVIYKYFRKKEKKLYALSDYIGCMSQANIDFLLSHNSDVDKRKVGLCVNSIVIDEKPPVDKEKLREKFGIPTDKTVFFYGGNFGKPQGIPFLSQVIQKNIGKDDRYFVLCGDGTDFPIVKKLVDDCSPDNVKLIQGLPKSEYDELLRACDIGMLFLDYRFTIPNFPSRLLPYLDYSMPVFACTDRNTDITKTVVDGDFGWSCYSDDVEACCTALDNICTDEKVGDIILSKGENARKYLEDNYSASITYRQIIDNI